MAVCRSAGRVEPCRFEVLGHRDVGLPVENTILEPFMPWSEGQCQDVQIVARFGIQLPPSSGPGDLGGIDVNRHDRALMRGDIVAKASCRTAALLSRPTEPRGMSVLLIAGRGSGYEPSTTGSPCSFARLAHASVRFQAQLEGLPQRRSGLWGIEPAVLSVTRAEDATRRS
jgi:hypothetical protein